MQIDWSKAPEWAMWHAFDRDGFAFWYEKKPQKESFEFVCIDGDCMCDLYIGKEIINWDDTLEHRTEQQTQPQPDYTAQLLAIVEQQKAKGLAKYGVALEDANLSALELVEHALEEAVDLSQYLLALRDKLRKDVTP